ncbi:hypothetical protein AAT19DRAFT_9673 [Rhodotorula toruloides]|uniref:Uncharacterized protein n=1 Tax=Rhodotorula toruloides TaxID=5286 RepID=A0A2T0A2T9_RHOTO|nr:hypothetical protein AAT19DRAFT_9673 [Rhodotorula toruloides]
MLRVGAGSPSGSEVGGEMMRRHNNGGQETGSRTDSASSAALPSVPVPQLASPSTGPSPSRPSSLLRSASLNVGSKLIISILEYCVARSPSGVGMWDQMPLVDSESRKEGAGSSWRRVARIGESGDSPTRTMSEVDRAEAPGENGASFVSAEGEESLLMRASTLSDFAGAIRDLVDDDAKIVFGGPFDGEVGQLGREDRLKRICRRR